MPVDDNALSLVKMMDRILARVQGGFEQAGVVLPDRQYWTLGTPAADCEQLVVSFNQAYIGGPGDEAQEPRKCDSPRSAQLSIQILRCVPTSDSKGRSPSGEKIQAASVAQAIDAWVLLDIAAHLDTWDEDLPGFGLGVIATVDAGEAAGGYQGPTLNLAVAIP